MQGVAVLFNMQNTDYYKEIRKVVKILCYFSELGPNFTANLSHNRPHLLRDCMYHLLKPASFFIIMICEAQFEE